jgi:aspartyl-tRNA synthetase
MKLPNAHRASIPAAKITAYLLSLQHPDGRSKARFFMHFGFDPKNWQQLADALRQHALENEVVSQQQTRFGVKWIIDGPLMTPEGRNPHLRTIWFTPTNSEIPGLVTAYPCGVSQS